MEKWFKYILYFLATSLLLGIIGTLLIPRSTLSPQDKVEIRQMVSSLNDDLPRNVGTIGTLDSITFFQKAFIYNFSVNGDNNIQEVYTKHYDEFRELLIYSIVTMNGQRNMGIIMATFLDNKKLDMGVRIYTPDKEKTEWRVPGSELKMFLDSCKMSPTTALHNVINLNIEIANLHLPVTLDDLNNPIKSIALNSIYGDIDYSCLPQSVYYKNNDIVFTYEVDEAEYDLEYFGMVSNNPDALNLFASILSEDPDIQEFMGIIALSHSNMVIQYRGRNTNNQATIRIPYYIIKKYCIVPQELLT